MPFNSLPAGDFINREKELDYLKLLAGFRDKAITDNILLEGGRGVGKTELLKQFYRVIFWEEEKVVPFYYSFQRATLKATFFAKDYFARFVRQYLACMKKDPSYADDMTTPLIKLLPVISSLGLEWMVTLIENFQGLMDEGDTCERLLGAISAPALAARENGISVIIMLDDFTMAAHLYQENWGDSPGLITLFEGPMKSSLCPHILTGSPDGSLESVFADSSFRGKAERMVLSSLPEDAARNLFSLLCEKFGVRGGKDISPAFLRLLQGNPLYLRNMAKALWKMRKKEASDKDLWECYSFEVTEGETAFYWTSILREFIGDRAALKNALALLMHLMRSNGDITDVDRLSKILGVPGAALASALSALKTSGILHGIGESAQLKDNVLRDVLSSLSLCIAEGKRPEQVRQQVVERYYRPADAAMCFEMVIPMASDAELVVAKAFEQIGKNLQIDHELIKQIQLALIESAINAIEHSGSYEKKVGVKITASPGRLEIVIESPGRFFDPDKIGEQTVEEKLRAGDKRGWGLKMMRKIMDEVKVERIGENTRVILIKNIAPSGVSQ
jgi:anti-sigma regulatory factor (Ser/Thr protein kinase)